MISRNEEVKRFLRAAHVALADAADIPERGEDFATSVTEKIESMAETVEKGQFVTAAQWTALDNMHDGIKRWLR